MLATQVAPATLRTVVTGAVTDGAWTPADIVATVAAETLAARDDIVATLWDLVDEGALVYDAALHFSGFRPATTGQEDAS